MLKRSDQPNSSKERILLIRNLIVGGGEANQYTSKGTFFLVPRDDPGGDQARNIRNV